MVSYKGLLIHIYCHLKLLKLLFSCFTDKNVLSNTFLGMIKNCWNRSTMSEKRFLSHFFATRSFLNCWIIIVHTTREPGTNFQAWSKIVELAQHFGLIWGLLIQFSCHLKFLKLLFSYSTNENMPINQFSSMVKNCWSYSTIGEKRFLSDFFATESFLNSPILIMHTIRNTETNFWAWSKIDELA